MSITKNSVVAIQYKVFDVDTGDVIDSSEGGAPLVYLHGAQNIIPGLENALEGKAVGDELEVAIAPEDAYGEYSEERVQEVPKEAFGEIETIEPGMAFSAESEQGPVSLIVTEVTDNTVTVDANHPLAGKSLKFEVSIESVRDATDEEIEHGHVHGEGGHQH